MASGHERTRPNRRFDGSFNTFIYPPIGFTRPSACFHGCVPPPQVPVEDPPVCMQASLSHRGRGG